MEGWRNAAKFYKQVANHEKVDRSLIKDARAHLSLDDIFKVGQLLMNKACSFLEEKYYKMASTFSSIAIELCQDLPMNTKNIPRFEVLIFNCYHVKAWISVKRYELDEAKIYCTIGINSTSKTSLIQEKEPNPGKVLALLANINLKLREFKSPKENSILALGLEPDEPRALLVQEELKRLRDSDYTSDEADERLPSGSGEGDADISGSGSETDAKTKTEASKAKNYMSTVFKFLRLTD